MKILLLIRHAQAEKNDILKDIDRPLTKRGKEDAVRMAHSVMEWRMTPQLIISSTAKRAHGTAVRMAAEWRYDKSHILEKKKLYMADMATYYDVIRETDNQYDTIAVVGHNPAIALLANSLTADTVMDFPTCSVAAFKISVTTWGNFSAADKELLFLKSPKMK